MLQLKLLYNEAMLKGDNDLMIATRMRMQTLRDHGYDPFDVEITEVNKPEDVLPKVKPTRANNLSEKNVNHEKIRKYVGKTAQKSRKRESMNDILAMINEELNLSHELNLSRELFSDSTDIEVYYD